MFCLSLQQGPVLALLNLNFKGFSINWFTYLFFALFVFSLLNLLVKLFVCLLMNFFLY